MGEQLKVPNVVGDNQKVKPGARGNLARPQHAGKAIGELRVEVNEAAGPAIALLRVVCHLFDLGDGLRPDHITTTKLSSQENTNPSRTPEALLDCMTSRCASAMSGWRYGGRI